jgi:crotonobetainyl-CoA:carnitine CoA-transferase CaiB-like acyl-CoA transferase
VLHALVRTADVVQHNMRYDAAERLGVLTTDVVEEFGVLE